MSEHEKTDHWQDLANLLGAEPPPLGEKGSIEEPPPWASPVGPPAPAPVEPPAPRPRAPTDWSRLANELGIEVPLKPEPEPTPKQETADLAREAAVSMVDELSPFQPLETAQEIFSEIAEQEGSEEIGSEGMDAREAVSEEVPAHETASAGGLAEQPGTGERRGRRRRRRRRGRREGLGKTSETSQPAEARPEPAEPGAGREAAERKKDEPDDRRSRHRRRRRGSDRPRLEEAVAGEPADAAPAQGFLAPEPFAKGLFDTEQEPAGAPAAAESDEFLDEPHGEADGESEGASDKPSHRAIPTWLDAVNLVISANLEARARQPDRKQSHPRGHRNHRGRDRSSDRGK
jgi:hypothetical protein